MIAVAALLSSFVPPALDVATIHEAAPAPTANWTTSSSPYGIITAPQQRHLVLSSGPAYLDETTFPKDADHVNLYWGKIPFEGKELKLRVLMYHVLAPNSKVSDVDVRFCIGLADAMGGHASIARLKWTRVNPSKDQPRNYIEVGRALAGAHMTGRFDTEAKPDQMAPTTSESGDVLGIGLELHTSTPEAQLQGLVAEIDIEADAPQAGRALVVRTVARKSGGDLGTSTTSTCAQPGEGDRGWWPKADLDVANDANHPVQVAADMDSFAAFSVGAPANDQADWAAFNHVDAKGKVATTNSMDVNGTKNSGLLGVNVMYTIHYRGPQGSRGFLDGDLFGLHDAYPTGQVVAGPFELRDKPWLRFAKGELVGAARWSLVARHAAESYESARLGRSALIDDQVRSVSFLIANAASSMGPSALRLTRVP